MKKHLGLDFPCNTCDKVCDSKDSLRQHERYVHCEDWQKLNCHLCETKFATTNRLNRHLDNVHKLKPKLKCEICAKRFSKDDLKRHMENVHASNAEVNCDHCMEKLSVKSVRSHMRDFHNNIDKTDTKCDICDRTIKKTDIYRHKKNMHGM